MRGLEDGQVQLFYQINVEEMIPENHPLRTIRIFVERVLTELSPKLDCLYKDGGKPSIPPERLLRALLLQKLYTIRSERQMEEHLHYNFLYRWFVGLQPDEKPWDHSTVSKNQPRLLAGDIAREFLQAVVGLANEANLLSDEHFTVDGTLLEAAASLKSFKPRENPKPPEDDDPGNPTVNFHKEKRRNDTHISTTDPEARLFRKGKGKEAKLCFMGHKTMDNRYGLVVEAEASQATGKAEVETSERMLRQVRKRVGKKRLTVGEDKGYDRKEHIQSLRQMRITPHVSVNTSSGSGLIDGRTYCKAGYAVSQRKRKRIEETFGWDKVIGGLRRLQHVGLEMADFHINLTSAAYNLVRMVKLVPNPA
jgi:transposase